MKRIIAVLAVLAFASFANAATYVTNYVSGGQFEGLGGGPGPWGNQFGPDGITFPDTGGNPGGCAQVDDTSATYGGFAYVNPPTDAPLAALGLTAGQNYTFVMDMKIVSGTTIGGLKLESWSDTAIQGNSGDMRPASGSTSWATYTFNYTISPFATFLNIVPLWGGGSVVQFDNIGVVVRLPEPVTASITSPANTQIVYSNFTINATTSVYPGSVTNAAFYIDGALQANDPTAPYVYVATGVSAGAHTLQVVATDSSGNTGTSSVVNVTVSSAAVPAGGITLDAASSGSTGDAAASSCTWSHTVGSGVNRMLVVGISAESSSSPVVSSVTYGGVALAHVPGARAITGSTFDTADQWFLMSPPVGTANIVVTFSTTLAGFPSTGGAACGAVSLFGVKQDAPEAVAINNTGTTATNSITTSITTLTAGAWLVDVVNHGNGGSSFSGAPGTKQWDLRASTAYTICSGGGATVPVPTAGLVTDTWTWAGTSSRMAQSIAAYAPGVPVLLTESATITSPTNNQVVSTTSFTISADATVSPGAITNVNFFVDNALVGNRTASPFSFTVNGASAGAHALKVAAKDNNGNSVTSAVVNVTAQNFAPTVALTSPANGTAYLLGASVPLAATASDDGTVTSVSFYLDGSLLSTDTTSPYNATWASATLGTHALTAVAHDNGGLNTTSAVVTINCLATFFAYEPFNYDALPTGTPTTAQGFTGNWTCAGGGAIVPSLTYTGLATTNNALSSGGGRNYVSFAAPLSSGTEWISFMCTQTGDPGGVNNGVYFLNGGTGLYCGFGLAPATATQGRLGLGSMNTVGTGYQTASTLSISPNLENYGTTYLVVLRIDFNTSGNNDTVTVYLNSAVHAAAPGVAPDQIVTSFDVGTITGIGLNAGNTAFTVDEIRRGSTYAEVVGGLFTPTVPTKLALSVGPSEQLHWSAFGTNYYQPQKSSDNSSWTDIGSLLFGSTVTSVYDTSPQPYYRVQEILPVLAEQIVDGGFEISDGATGAFYWVGGGSEPPTRITSDFHQGTACMSLFVTNADAAAQTCYLQQKLSYAGGGTIIGGNSYFFSFWAKSLGKNPSGGYVQQCQVQWLNSGGASIGSVGVGGFTPGPGAWTQISTGPLVAPAAAVDALILVSCVTGGFLGDFGGVLVDDMSLAAFSPSGTFNALSPTLQSGGAFTATIFLTNGLTATAASGTVQFTTNNVSQSVGTVAGGAATGAPAALPSVYTVTATYSGDDTYIGSTTNLIVGTPIATNPTNMTFSISGNTLHLSWPADHLGWTMQSNSVGLASPNNWFDVPNSQNGTNLAITLDATKPRVFYRLHYTYTP